MGVLMVVLTWEIVDVRPRGRACEIIFVGGDWERACKHAWVEINPASPFQRDCIQPTSLFQTHSDVLESNLCGIRVCLAVCPDCPTSSRLTARPLEKHPYDRLSSRSAVRLPCVCPLLLVFTLYDGWTVLLSPVCSCDCSIFMFFSFILFLYLTMCLYISMSIYRSVFLSVSSFFCLCICLSVLLSFFFSLFLFFFLSFYISIFLSFYLYVSLCLSVFVPLSSLTSRTSLAVTGPSSREANSLLD